MSVVRHSISLLDALNCGPAPVHPGVIVLREKKKPLCPVSPLPRVPLLSRFLWRRFPPDQACGGHPSSGRRWNNIVARQSYTEAHLHIQTWTMDRGILCLFTKHFTVVDWTWLENGAQMYDYYVFLATERVLVCSQAGDNRRKTVTAKRLFFLSECRKRLSLCAQIAQHSDHRCPFCSPDMNDACLCVCLGLMPSLLGTASWGHCSFCLSASLWCFSYLFRRRSAVGWSCMPLTLRKMKDSHQRGYCTQYSNIKISPDSKLVA